MAPPEEEQHTIEHSPTVRRVYPGRNDLYFWLYAEVTQADGTKRLEILLPRTPIGQLNTELHERYRTALASTDAQLPSESPQQPQDRGKDHRYPARELF